MSKHTAGPWEVVKHERFPFQREVKAEEGYICDMEGLSDEDMPTVEANANLIATAPEMHEALKLDLELWHTLLMAQFSHSRIPTLIRERIVALESLITRGEK